MKEFKNKVAGITGAASGIGKGLAKVCFNKGMKIALIVKSILRSFSSSITR